MEAFTNAVVFTGEEMRQNVSVLVEEGVVQEIVLDHAIPAGTHQRDLKGALLAPGFIDVQVNGGGGILFNHAPTQATVARIAAAHRRFGTTGLLPTLISDSQNQRRQARAAVIAARAAGVPSILGLHLEGPHINPDRRGVHDARWLTPPNDEDATLLVPLPEGITLVTLAPESVPLNLIASLASRGVRLSIGHSAASLDLTRAALDAGVTGFTHLFNAMPPATSREPGVVGAALDDQNSWCGLIVDGHHLHDATVRLAWRAKPGGKIFLVTDAMPPVGHDNPSFRLGDETIQVTDGRCLTRDGRLAGSALDMASAVRNCVQRVGLPLEEALRMASLYPASFLGLEHRYGRIAPGYAADMVALDHRLFVLETFIGGQGFRTDQD